MDQLRLVSRTGKPEVLIDVPAVVGQFLTDLTIYDLVVELVQNELDAGSSKTIIKFQTDMMTCEGNGKAIDSAGWKRLRYVLGAGGDVAAKIGGIGAKNHGLRSAFLLGDTIIVQSAGYRVDLTVRGDEAHPSRFFPAVWPKIPDAMAPRRGTRITVPYRAQELRVPNGDNTSLSPQTPETITALFKEAILNSPSRFIGASSPGRSWNYELALQCGGEVSRLIFECQPLKDKLAGFICRTCQLQETGKRSRAILQQLGSTFELQPLDSDHAKIPKLFRRGHRLLGELTWNVNRDFMPEPGCGGLRYPIGYPIENVRSGYGFNISGPFISGRARHSLSDDPRNRLIRKVGCAAFVELTREKLIPLFGAKALDLVPALEFPDAEAELALIKDLLAASALPVATVGSKVRTSGFKTGTMPTSGEPVVTIAHLSYHQDQIHPGLALLAASAKNILHPSVHQRIISGLCKMREAGDTRVVLYNESTAALTIIVDEAPPENNVANDAWMERILKVLGVLEHAHHHVPPSSDLVNQLKSKGKLPTANGRVAQWAHVRFSIKPVPPIPGIVDPSILHPTFLKLKVLKDGPLKISKFDLDEFVSTKDFTKVIPEGRQRFFNWLRKGHLDLKPRALAKIAEYPIWPGVDGQHRSLHVYCWPKSLQLRHIIHSAHVAPSEEVVAFPGLRRSPNGALRMRSDPSEEEIRKWYLKECEVVTGYLGNGLIDDAVRAVSNLEKGLEYVQQTGNYRIDVIATNHCTFSRSRTYKPVAELHCPTTAVETCRLLDSDMVRGTRARLYAALNAHQKPTCTALVRALVSDTNSSALFSRLHAYKSLGYDLGDLSEESIVTVHGKAMPPARLTFPSSTNWWGEWKIPLESFPSIPEHVDLLERVGVVRQALREELSRSFFDWLAEQNQTTRKRHLQQIIRHWGERRHGPLKWVHKYPTTPCIPVYGASTEFDLLSHRQVTSIRSAVFLPDFREIQEKVISNNRSARLVITSARSVGDSVLDVMREVGVPSLRTRAGRPTKILTSGDIEGDAQLDKLLDVAQSKTTLGMLTQMLPEHNVPVSALRRDWRRRLEAIKGARIAGRLTAIYSMLSHEYEIPADSGIDEPTQLLCIDRKADRKLAFYEALADHLFSDNSSSLWAYGLLRAIESRHQPTLFDFSDYKDDDPTQDEEEPKGEGQPGSDPPKSGHGLNPDKLEPAVPDPGPLKDINETTKIKSKKKAPRRRPKSSTDDRRNSVEEEEQKLALKEKHYGWHCQACLGQYEAIKAAPPQSYVYLPSIRRKLIEAHHVEHLQNNGAIGAKNLLILCSFHHDYFGDRLSAISIKDALTSAQRVVREFPSNGEGTTFSKLEGLIIEIKSTGGTGRLFFTHEHANAWKGSTNEDTE